MKGPSWADATDEGEEELIQRQVEAQRNRLTTTNTTVAGQSPQSIQTHSQPNQNRARNQREENSNQRYGNNYNDRDPRSSPPASSPTQRVPRYGGYGGALNNNNNNHNGPSSSPSSSPYSREPSTQQQWSRGESVRGGGRDSRDHPRSSRDRPPPPVDNTPRERGIIHTVKESFGFITCEERQEQVFFHFADFPSAMSHQPPRKGDEVSFRIQIDQRDGRLRAQQLEALPKGTVQFETIVSEHVRGVVIREMRGQFQQAAGGMRKGKRLTLAESLAQGRQEAFGGKIRRLKDESASSITAATSSDEMDEEFEFSERDLADPNVLLFVGDRIEFNIFLEKKSKRKGATQVKLIEPNPDGRERGRVVSVKDGFGFIEIEKEIDEDEDDAQQQQQQNNRFQRSNERQGDQLFFHFSELIDQTYTPQVGDELSFRMDKSPAEGQRLSAQRIQLLPKGSLSFKEVGKELLHGTVTKEITYERPPKENVKNKEKDSSDSTSDGTTTTAGEDAPIGSESNESSATDAAASSTSAPPPTDASNTPARDTPSKSAARKMVPGTITYVDADGKTIELPFRPSDVQSDRRQPAHLLQGDAVSFHLLTLSTRTGVRTRATQISVKSDGWTKLNREQGIVTIVREGFAFVESVARSDKVFLHASQMKGVRSGSDKLFVGLEVEFNIVFEAPGKPSAIRVATLPAGSVKFEETLPQLYTAKVSKGIKRKESNRNAPKPGSDASNFSNNDLRRDQASATTAPPAHGADRGEKGELNNITPVKAEEAAPVDGASSSSSQLTIPSSVNFFEIDVLDPADGLDPTSLLVGDTVEFQLKRHKRNGRLTAMNVVLKQMEPTGREKGQVCRIKQDQGLGFLLTLSKVAPTPFLLRDAPKGHKVQVGDCFEFNISEPIANNKKDRDARASHSHSLDDKPHAVRLTPLPTDSLQIETIDRSVRMRGYVTSVPERSGRGGKQLQGGASTKVGQVVRLTSSNAKEVVHLATTLASIFTHPACWPIVGVPVQPFTGEYAAGSIHPAYLTHNAPKTEVVDEKFSFTLSDVTGSQYLSKGDLLDFYVSQRTQPVLSKRAVEITLTPIQGTVEKIEYTSQGGNGASRSYTGIISVFNPQSSPPEETFVFNSKDCNLVSASSSSSSTTVSSSPSPSPSPSPPLPNELAVGDIIEFTEVTYSADKKKRQAKQITRKEGAKPSVRPPRRVYTTSVTGSSSSDAPLAPLIPVARFARGPDKEGIGFAPRKSQAGPVDAITNESK